MLLAHPQELENRRTACRTALAEIGPLRRELHACCVVCGRGPGAVLAQHDRYGFPARIALCLHCGLVYLVDALCEEAREKFRRSGAYHRLAGVFGGEQPDDVVLREAGGPEIPAAVDACDLQSGFRALYESLPEGGTVECRTLDLLALCRVQGPPGAVVGIERCYWILQETAWRVFACLGFEVLSEDASRDPWIAYRLRKCRRTHPVWDPCDETMHAILREFREIDAQWRENGKLPLNRADSLRRRAFRAKRLLIRTLHLPL